MRRSSTFMLVAAVILGVLAVFIARYFLLTGEKPAAVAAVPETVAVVAAKPLALGDVITPETLRLAPWPAGALPANAIKSIDAAVADKGRIALRAIAANELVTDAAISGKGGRLSASGMIRQSMRAVAVPVNEVAGAGGFVVAGDRVDVYLTHSERDRRPPFTDVLIQNARVLAIGQDANVSKDKPEVTRTATLEVTPAQAQKVALAQQVGTLTLGLRAMVDEASERLGTTRVGDLVDGTRRVRPPVRWVRVVKVRTATPPPLPLEVAIVRGTTPTSYPMGYAR